MVAYSFQNRFVPMITDGTKRQTIRGPRKRGRHAEVGDVLQLYQGLRSRTAKLLRKAVCTASVPIEIIWRDFLVVVDIERVGLDDAFARADGFTDLLDMRDWFASYHGPGDFTGRLIKW